MRFMRGPEDGNTLSEDDKVQQRRAGLRVGRPKVGQRAKRLNLSMEERLLKTAGRFAQKHGMTRAGLIAKSVKACLSGAA
jgi:hypothetical protein